MEVKSEKFASWADVKKALEKKEKEKELGYEQKNAIDHLRKFCKISEKEEKEMREELKAAVSKLNERHLTNIVNFLPMTNDELRVLFADERTVLSDEDKSKIVSIVKAKLK